jgi:hypothetical protein
MQTRIGKTGIKTAGSMTGTGIGIAALVALAGCGGQTSFFEVTVTVNNPMVDRTMITSCEMTVSGSATDGPFSLAGCDHVTAQTIGVFQYGTDAESGTVSFHVVAFNGSRGTLGVGDSSGAIKKGGRTPISLAIGPP